MQRFLRLSGVYKGLVQGSRPRRRRLVAGEAVWLSDAWRIGSLVSGARGPIGLVVVSPDIRRTRVAVLVLDRLLGAVYESNLDQPCSHLSDASRRALNVLNERRYRARSDHGEARRRVLRRNVPGASSRARVGPTTRKRRKPRRRPRKRKSKRPTSRTAPSSRASTR